jgi:hypothetical protein
VRYTPRPTFCNSDGFLCQSHANIDDHLISGGERWHGDRF